MAHPGEAGRARKDSPWRNTMLCLTGEYAAGCANLPLYFGFQKTPYSSKYRFYSLLRNTLAKLDKCQRPSRRDQCFAVPSDVCDVDMNRRGAQAAILGSALRDTASRGPVPAAGSSHSVALTAEYL